MTPAPFLALYFACLGFCLAGIEGLRRVEPLDSEPPPQRIAEVTAVPPKPEGAPSSPKGEDGGEPVTREGCLQLSSDYRDACFSALAWQLAERDPDGALAACEEVEDPEGRWECHSDVAEMHALQNATVSEGICRAIPRKRWHDQCWFGMALAHAKVSFEPARAYCEQAGMWRDFCRHDVNGEIAQVDAAAALAWCDLEQGTSLQRKTCYHGLGKYLGRTDPSLAAEICDSVPTHEPLYRQNCHHGLGWALAESEEEAALRFCGAQSSHPDSCRMGVSSHAKRLDPARAWEICEGVEDRSLRDRCASFAKR